MTAATPSARSLLKNAGGDGQWLLLRLLDLTDDPCVDLRGPALRLLAAFASHAATMREAVVTLMAQRQKRKDDADAAERERMHEAIQSAATGAAPGSIAPRAPAAAAAAAALSSAGAARQGGPLDCLLRRFVDTEPVDVVRAAAQRARVAASRARGATASL